MAGDWIKMRMDLAEDPAVYRLATLTKLDRLSVVGRLYAFWAWADRHAVDGVVDGAASTVVDDIVRFDGFANAMASVNWLELGEGYIAIPNHDRHNGESAKERCLKNQRQTKWRSRKTQENVDATPSTAASTTPSTREEKRREYKNTGDEYAADFLAFWGQYPNKTSKAAAAKAWRKLKPSATLTATILQDVAGRDWKPPFIPHASTYLNGRRWEDERDVPAASGEVYR